MDVYNYDLYMDKLVCKRLVDSSLAAEEKYPISTIHHPPLNWRLCDPCPSARPTRPKTNTLQLVPFYSDVFSSVECVQDGRLDG